MSDGRYRSSKPAWALKRLHDRPVALADIAAEAGLSLSDAEIGVVKTLDRRDFAEYPLQRKCVPQGTSYLRLVRPLSNRVLSMLSSDGSLITKSDAAEIDRELTRAKRDLRELREASRT
jgi:hypothetical protein